MVGWCRTDILKGRGQYSGADLCILGRAEGRVVGWREWMG